MWHYVAFVLVVLVLASFQVRAITFGELLNIFERGDVPSQEILEQLTPKDAETLMAINFGLDSITSWYNLLDKEADLSGFAPSVIVRNLTTEQLDSMHPKVCGFLLEFLDYFKNTPLPGKQCRAHFISNVSQVRILTIKAIPPAWLNEDGYDLVRSLSRTSPRFLTYFNEATFEELGKNPQNACSLLTIENLLVRSRYNYHDLDFSRCVAAIPELPTANISPNDSSILPSSIFSSYNGQLTDHTIANMTRNQFALLCGNFEGLTCMNLRVELFPNYLEYIYPGCLGGHLLRKDVFLKEKLSQLCPRLIKWYKNFLPATLETLIEKEDYKYLPKELKLKLIEDDELYEILRRLDEKSILSEFDLTLYEFKSLEDKSIRWLKQTNKKLPDAFLSRFEPEDITKIFKTLKSWDILASNNPNVIKSLTSEAKVHYCSTLSIEQYESNLVLRRFGGDACRNALKFKITKKTIRELPELVLLKGPPKIVKSVGPKWWGKVGAILGMILVETDASLKPPPSALKFMNGDLLSLITGSISHFYRDFINSMNADNLAPDAFLDFASFRQSITLADLYPAQIATLPDNVFDVLDSNDMEELDLGQFQAVTPSQWESFGEKIAGLSEKFLQCIDHKATIKLSRFITPAIAPKLNDFAFRLFTKREFTQLKLTDLRVEQIHNLSSDVPLLEDALWNVPAKTIPNLSIFLSSSQLSRHSDFKKVQQEFETLEYIEQSLRYETPNKLELGKSFFETCSQILQLNHFDKEKLGKLVDDVLKSLPVRFTAEEVEALYSEGLGSRPMLKRFLTDDILALHVRSPFPWKFGVRDGMGYDFVKSIRNIKASPEALANPNTTIKLDGAIDAGGPLNSWIEYVLTEMRDRCTVPILETGERKFSWLRDRRDGFTTGIMFAKAIQRGLKLPFALDPSFYGLIGEPDDKKIEEYFEVTFAKEMEEYKTKYLGRNCKESEFSALLQELMLLDPVKLQFDCLDGSSVSNLTTFKEEDGMFMSPYNYETIVSDYFERDLKPRILNGFKAFVREFNDGMSTIIDMRPLLPLTPVRLQKRFTGFLNQKEHQIELILPLIKWEEGFEKRIDSFFKGHQLTVQEIVESFLKALEPQQLAKFIKIWAGSSSLTLLEGRLKVSLKNPSASILRSVKGWWEPSETPGPPSEWVLVSAGDQYKDLLKKIAREQAAMLKLVDYEFDLESLEQEHREEVYSAKADTCFNFLTIIDQSGAKIIQSLVELLNMHEGFFEDTMVL